MRKGKRIKNKVIAIAMLTALLCAALAMPVSANSAPTYWEGTDATGAVLSEGDCPLVVEHETLTFDLTSLPQSYYNDPADYLAYSASVKAEYTFYNPTDMTVTAKLLFPYGTRPTYAASDYDPETGEYTEHLDLAKYGAQVDGQPVQTVVRHSFASSSYDPDPLGSLEALHDGYAEDGFFSRDLPVYVYTFRVTDLDSVTYKAARASIFLAPDAAKTRVMLSQSNGGKMQENGVRLTNSVDNGDELTVYVFGEDLTDISWEFYENGSMDRQVPGRMEQISREQLTFEQYALQAYDQQSGIASHDYNNAVIACLAYSRWDDLGVHTQAYMLTNLESYLLEWYEYEITLAPGQRLTNTVTAPMYPHIDGKYLPEVFTYVYLLSPATRWADFGTLDIVINTPYYMIDVDDLSQAPSYMEDTKIGVPFESFEKTDTGYRARLQGLPEGELRFMLSADPAPERQKGAWDALGWLLGIVAVLFAGGVVLGVILILAMIAVIALLMALSPMTAVLFCILAVLAVLLVAICAVIGVLISVLSA